MRDKKLFYKGIIEMKKFKTLQPVDYNNDTEHFIYVLPNGKQYEDVTPHLPIKLVKHPTTKETYCYKDIPGFNGAYGVTYDGKILSFKSRHINTMESEDYPLSVRIMKQQGCGAKREYRMVNVAAEAGVPVQILIHRIVAECWIGLPTEYNPDGTLMKTPPEINHKDLQCAENEYTNLEWCDRFYNNKHRASSKEWNYTHNTNATGRKPVEHSEAYLLKKSS